MRYILLIITYSFGFIAWGKSPVTVVLVDGGYPPFYFAEDDPRDGIYKETLAAIFDNTDFMPKYIYVSQRRKYRFFAQGKVVLEPAVNPAWRKKWADVSLYTDAFAKSTDVLVHAKGKIFSATKTENFRGKSIGATVGYTYPFLEPIFAQGLAHRDEASREVLTLKKLAKGRIDAAVVNREVARHLIAENKWALVIGDTIGNVPVMMRVHKSANELVPIINKKIKILQKKQVFQAIYNKDWSNSTKK